MTVGMEEADTLCHRIAIVDHSKVIALGSPQELKRSIPGEFLVQLHFDKVPEALIARLQVLFNGLFMAVGLRQFKRKALT